MTGRAGGAAAGTSSCPPAELIAALVEGSLDHEARRRIDVHVSDCPECREVIGAVGSDEAATSAGVYPETLAAGPREVLPEPAHLPLAHLLATARIGEVVDAKWRLVRLLGTGGMGQVFEAVNVHDGSRGALKLLRPELVDHHEVARRFLRERYAANRIDHPAFVRVLEDGVTSSGAPYLVMELVEGDTLRKVVLREGPLPEARVKVLGAQILEAVAAAHAAGVLHRDLKPDNVALEREGALRILDFGIARLTDAGESEGSTITGQMLGTPTYMPPEQARGIPSQIDERVDVFATAATMVFLLTGSAIRPVTGALFEAMTQPVLPVRTLAPTVSPRLARVLDRALAFEREDRYPSASAMRLALLDESGEQEAIATARRAPDRGRVRRAPLLAAALLVVGGSVAAAAYLTAKSHRTVTVPALDPNADQGARAAATAAAPPLGGAPARAAPSASNAAATSESSGGASDPGAAPPATPTPTATPTATGRATPPRGAASAGARPGTARPSATTTARPRVVDPLERRQ